MSTANASKSHQIDEIDVVGLSDEEDSSEYVKGGYHPVNLGDIFNGQYYVIRKLGWGTFSTVWLCWDMHGKRFTAVKVIKSELTSNGAAKDEVDILRYIHRRDLRDPYRVRIVNLLDSFVLTGVNGTHTCTVFEVMGSNLLRVVTSYGNKGLPLANIKKIIRQVLEGLKYLHMKCRIFHADLKLENILTCADEKIIFNLVADALKCHENKATNSLARSAINEMKAFLGAKSNNRVSESRDFYDIKIADLGCACWMSKRYTEYIQTREYRAIEVILGCDFGPAADIWSVGCIAFELATGCYLFDIDQNDGMAKDQCHLLQIVELLGEVPLRLLTSGSRSKLFFDENGKLLHRSEVNSGSLVQLLTKFHDWNVQQAQEFCDFVLPMLTLDPKERPTAIVCLRHPWLEERSAGKMNNKTTKRTAEPLKHMPYNLRPRKRVI